MMIHHGMSHSSHMISLVNCSGCRTPLQLPPGVTTIRCAICHAITPPQRTPSPYNHLPAGQLPSVNGRKRAVICGISYRNSNNELKGSINDAKCMKFMLVNRFKFPESSVVMLTDEESTVPDRLPTKHNIRVAMYWLVRGCKPGDSLVFHFSGHGSQERNINGDEASGFDGTLCPSDFETQGIILDDEINVTIVRPLPVGVKLHAIIDACHSGTMLDLPFLCRMDRSGRYVWEDHRPPSGVWKGTSGGEVILFSGCDDNQTSADTRALSRVTSTGAMTFSFIQAIERGGHMYTYGDIMNSMRSTLRKNEIDAGGGGTVTSFLSMLLTGGSLAGRMRLKQEPQLTCSDTFDVYKRRFSL